MFTYYNRSNIVSVHFGEKCVTQNYRTKQMLEREVQTCNRSVFGKNGKINSFYVHSVYKWDLGNGATLGQSHIEAQFLMFNQPTQAPSTYREIHKYT
jgi:hypothetical protein